MKLPSFILFILVCWSLPAQSVMTLDQALQIAMENNQDIAIAEQLVRIEQRKVFKGNAGLTPTVRAFAGGEYSQNNLVFELNNFGENSTQTQRISEDLAFSMSHNAGIRLDYTLSNGGRGKHQLQQLQNLADLSTLQLRLTVENTLLNVTQLYLGVSSLEQTEQLLTQNIELSHQRLEQAEIDKKYAKSGTLSVLRARTDLNTDSVSLRNLQRDLSNTKERLLRLLNINEEYAFSTVPVLNPDKLPELDQLRTYTLQRNVQVLLAKQGVFIEEQQLKIDASANVPQVDVFAGPSFLRQDYEVNQIRSSQTIGPTAGFSVNYLLRDGKKRQRTQEIQRMKIVANRQEQELATENVLLELSQAWNDYQTIQEQLGFERDNLSFYEENLQQSMISNEAGKIPDTEVRSAQLSLLSAEVSIARQEIELQQTYFQLLSIAGLITTF
ncbi:MAG: TolC family protein [Bacteroidota bacterium]